MTKKTMLRYSGWSILGLLLIGVLVAAALTIRSTERTAPEQVQDSADSQAEIITNLQKLIEEDEAAQQQANSGTRTAALDTNREKGEEFGVAVTHFNSPENAFELDLFAELSDPQPGGSYVVTVSNADSKRELGTLIKEIENSYYFVLSQSESLEMYTTVSIEEVNREERELVLQGIFE